ncbi:hypothetical protein Pyn_38099 [Prunus yedoensis var. nudiflora]|uniref:Uncharacterized protein n=1 Tax=Prunus yedoensis var. nudiflora TaxID=2094558 RepID=A0A314UFQ5_PRUYE|nr:hypothetical protein Pyn_38099 [Prunus yedoensis var. nudiflora]
MITQLTVTVPLHELIFRRIVASDRIDSTRVSLPFGDPEALPPARAAHASSSSGDPMLQFLTTQFETMHTHFDAQLETFKTEICNELTEFTRRFDPLST